MNDFYVFVGDAFALVYSIDEQESFEEVKNIREMILQVKGTDPVPPIVVVGNKCDLDEEKRYVFCVTSKILLFLWKHSLPQPGEDGIGRYVHAINFFLMNN